MLVIVNCCPWLPCFQLGSLPRNVLLCFLLLRSAQAEEGIHAAEEQHAFGPLFSNPPCSAACIFAVRPGDEGIRAAEEQHAFGSLFSKLACSAACILQSAQAEEGIRAAEERAKELEEQKHAMFLKLKKVGCACGAVVKRPCCWCFEVRS